MGPLVITRRGRRLVQVLVAVGLGSLLLVASGGGSDGDSGADDAWLGLRGDAALVAAPCPGPTSLAPAPASPGRTQAAREGRFRVFGSRYTELRPPIDWSTDPLAARRYRQSLQKLRWLDPLLYGYAAEGNTDDLRLALAIGLDWVAGNPRGGPRTPAEAWSDKVVGDRVPYLSYLLRAAACEGLISRRERSQLLEAIEAHARVLASPSAYVRDNHGLFVDLGLVRLTNFFPFLERVQSWRELARRRFESTLRGRLSQGVWLEHSSAYQLLAIRSLEAFLRVYGNDPELAGLLERMRAAAAWFVRPDGELTQFGDSNLEPVPEWASEQAAQASGLNVSFGAGFAFVRAAGESGDVGYLAVTAGFHNLTHKHADELSFELFDHGTPVVSDTGLYHKDPGEIRDFVVSSRAHSSLGVDGLEPPISNPQSAYGSGLLAAGEGEGWYAMEGRNPLLREIGVRHRRLFLYRPGEALVIVDRIGSSLPHTYTRYLQLHPAIELDPGPAGEPLAISAPTLEGSIDDLPGGSQVTRTQARGQREPMQGWTSPDFREFVPRWTVAYSGAATSETRALSISLDAAQLRATGVEATPRSVVVELSREDGSGSRLRVERERRRLEIAVEGD